MITSIKTVNDLHDRIYGTGKNRKHPKNGIVSIKTVKKAAYWLRTHKQINNGKQYEKICN